MKRAVIISMLLVLGAGCTYTSSGYKHECGINNDGQWGCWKTAVDKCGHVIDPSDPHEDDADCNRKSKAAALRDAHVPDEVIALIAGPEFRLPALPLWARVIARVSEFCSGQR
jgi:hypothetical protein